MSTPARWERLLARDVVGLGAGLPHDMLSYPLLDILAQRKGGAVRGRVRPCCPPCSLLPPHWMWADLCIRMFDLCASCDRKD